MNQDRERKWFEELAGEARAGRLDRRSFLKIAIQAGVAVSAAEALIGIKPAQALELKLKDPGFALPKHNYLLDKESPFEVKNILIDKAQKSAQRNAIPYINAGRGNPDFLNTTVRHAFAQLVHFSASAAGERDVSQDMGYRVPQEGLAAKLQDWLKRHRDQPGSDFLTRGFDAALEITSMKPDELAFQMVDAANGDFYPDPSRILPFTEKVVSAYLDRVLFGGKPPKGKFHLFATEGATAAMIYVFKSLKISKVLRPHDKVAIVTPIFSPYLEIPALAAFDLEEVYVPSDESRGWHVDQRELRRILADKSIKALYLINPSNPGAVALSRETVETVADMVEKYNPELVVINDTVYANFVDEFHTVAELIPQNTIGCYSYSKYFGVTGWRLGIVSIHEDCVVDRIIAKLPAGEKKELAERYSLVSTEPDKIAFYQRLEIDSRDVALAHTGGLSCPQQVIMSLFSLFGVMDEADSYKRTVTGVIKERWSALYGALGVPERTGSDLTRYYALVDVLELAEHHHGRKFAGWMGKQWPLGFLFHLAEDRATVCLPGEGFAGPDWSLRLALANVTKEKCAEVGKNINTVLEEYHRYWKSG